MRQSLTTPPLALLCRYNVILALFSATSFYVTATALGWDYGSGEWLRRLTGDTPQPLFQCPSRVWDSKLFVWTAKAFYYSKYVEYLDTAWLVLKGKNVSFLQAFHHFGAPWDVYLGIRLQNEGVWIFMFFNSFIHTIMYTYYGLTAAGYKIKAKPLITAMQISQFMGGFILVWDYINIPCFRSDNGKVGKTMHCIKSCWQGPAVRILKSSTDHRHPTLCRCLAGYSTMLMSASCSCCSATSSTRTTLPLRSQRREARPCREIGATSSSAKHL